MWGLGALLLGAVILVGGGCGVRVPEFTAPAVAAVAPTEWRQFEGAWFRISYPDGFVVRPSMESKTADGFDSAFFASPDGRAEFYVCSPQWGRAPIDIAIDETREELVAEKVSDGAKRSVRWWTIAALDSSYQRSYESIASADRTSMHVFGFRYSGTDARTAYLPSYRRFKESLRQLAD